MISTYYYTPPRILMRVSCERRRTSLPNVTNADLDPPSSRRRPRLGVAAAGNAISADSRASLMVATFLARRVTSVNERRELEWQSTRLFTWMSGFESLVAHHFGKMAMSSTTQK